MSTISHQEHCDFTDHNMDTYVHFLISWSGEILHRSKSNESVAKSSAS